MHVVCVDCEHNERVIVLIIVSLVSTVVAIADSQPMSIVVGAPIVTTLPSTSTPLIMLTSSLLPLLLSFPFVVFILNVIVPLSFLLLISYVSIVDCLPSIVCCVQLAFCYPFNII